MARRVGSNHRGYVPDPHDDKVPPHVAKEAERWAQAGLKEVKLRGESPTGQLPYCPACQTMFPSRRLLKQHRCRAPQKSPREIVAMLLEGIDPERPHLGRAGASTAQGIALREQGARLKKMLDDNEAKARSKS